MIERAFVSIEEGQIHLRRLAGSDAGAPPLLLFHASPSSSWSMQGLMRALAEAGCRQTLIAPDTLGNGVSPGPRPDAPDIAYFATVPA
jgi:pimeloyl-ACP methyl ester carboxylesterase